MQTNGNSCGALSLFTPIGYQSGDCGYCRRGAGSSRTPDTRGSYYARSKSLCPEHYQELMDRGWRRSGSLLYLPDASRSCCPHYTIRLPAPELKPIRDQRQALHRWNRFVLGENYLKEVNVKYPKDKDEKKRQRNTFDLVATVHESEFAQLKPDIKPDHRFEVTLERDSFTEEKYQLFDNYQRHVHHEGDADISRGGFRRFLCSSPLHRHDFGKKLGAYHQMYRLDGRLIAMAVLDLLPQAVSGVYFIYHSDFEKWSFGKLSALREAALAIEGEYIYYYMGYYIHNCKKMRYKGDYKPYVLDYDTLQWDPMDDEMKRLMDKRKWVSLERERTIRKKLAESSEDMEQDSDDAAKDAYERLIAAELYAVDYPDPMVATKSELSVLELHVPGTMKFQQLLTEVNLDEMKVAITRGTLHQAQDLVGWDNASASNILELKGIFAEFAACVGPNIAREVVIDLSREPSGG